jgi:L-ascorbate metabolism protein UlaG (beta-lactamase superfamily)
MYIVKQSLTKKYYLKEINMKFLHVRHATSILTYAGSKIIIDPTFSGKGEFPPIPLRHLQKNNKYT